MFVHNLPRNSAADSVYSVMAELHGPPPEPGSRAFERAKAGAERRLRILSGAIPSAEGRKLLDIGCSSGIFLNRARDAGFEVCGTEYAPEPARFAHDHFQLSVHCGDWREAGYADQSFDVITLFQILEYLPDPLAELATIRRLLKPGGFAVLSASNSAGLVPRLAEWASGPDRPMLRSLYRFTPYTLTEMAALAGYEPFRIDKPRPGIGNPFHLTVRNIMPGGLAR